jgi:hypothetical protein
MCNASRAALGYLLRKTGLLGLAGAACVLAAHASAASAPPPTLFHLSIVGTAHQQWTYSSAPVDDGTCVRTEKSEGIRAVTFQTKRPVLVRLLGGRVLPVDVRVLSGTVSLNGANTTNEVCGVDRNEQIADCAQTKRSFSAARIRVSSPRPGFAALGPVRSVRLARANCPFEPPDVIRRPLGPTLNTLTLPKEALKEQSVARINLTASRSQRVTYASPQSGNLQERAEWRLKFVRVSP